MRKPKVLLFSKFAHPVRQWLEEISIPVVRQKPNLVICIGGDGTLLLAEQRYPGVTKFLLRKSQVGKKGFALQKQQLFKLLDGLQTDKLRPKEYTLLEAVLLRGKKKIPIGIALNDIIVRNIPLNKALRFSVRAQRRLLFEGIGDGAIISTPFGSEAYFASITRKSFRQGIGIALNNVVQNPGHFLISGTVDIHILRGSAQVSADVRKPVTLRQHDVIRVKQSKQRAHLIIP
jgi:NAD+ kinase